MKLSKGENTKEKMVQVAISLVAKHGYAETSFQMISDKCELSQSAAMHHFKTKAGLLEAMIERVVEHNHELIAKETLPSDSAYDRLLKHFRGNLKWAMEYHDEGQILCLLFYTAAFDKKVRSLAEKTMQNGRTRIEELILAGQREKLFHFTGQASEVARLLHESLLGSMFSLIAAPSEGKEDQKKHEKRAGILIRDLTQMAS